MGDFLLKTYGVMARAVPCPYCTSDTEEKCFSKSGLESEFCHKSRQDAFAAIFPDKAKLILASKNRKASEFRKLLYNPNNYLPASESFEVKIEKDIAAPINLVKEIVLPIYSKQIRQRKSYWRELIVGLKQGDSFLTYFNKYPGIYDRAMREGIRVTMTLVEGDFLKEPTKCVVRIWRMT